jgi:cell division transport system ATP-binding protein
VIVFEHVSKIYDQNVPGMADATFHIEKGEFVFLVGPSGSGKSTLIKLVLKQLEPTEGRILVAGRNLQTLRRSKVPLLRRNIGCVFQDFRLLPNKTVFENVAFALEVIGRPRHVVANQVPQVLDLVGLAGKRDNLPGELSGGEQQRVAVARAFVNRPLILLADEPTGNLDSRTSVEIMEIFQNLNDKGLTIVLVTHEHDIAQFAKRVLVFRDGKIRKDDPVPSRPRASEVLKTLPTLED